MCACVCQGARSAKDNTYLCAYACVCPGVWSTKDNLESLLSLSHIGSKYQFQVISLEYTAGIVRGFFWNMIYSLNKDQ